MKLRLSSAALDDLIRLRSFLAETNPQAAQHAAVRLTQAIDTLTSLPERGKSVSNTGLRELVVPFGRSAYIVRFLTDREHNEVVIIRIWHSREART